MFFAEEDVVTLKIAHIGPTTGAAALYGLATQHGAEIAVDEINAAGGKYRIELINEDDEHNVEKVINAYNAALDAGAQMILGSTTSKPCEAAGAQGYTDRVFFLTPSASSTAVIEDKDNVFQVCFSDPNQGSASAEYIAGHQLGTKIAVIYNNADVYSTGIRDTFVEKSAELGLEIVSEETFTDETTDFTVQVGKAQEAGAEIVFLPMYYTPASLILKTAADKNYSPIFFGVDGMPLRMRRSRASWPSTRRSTTRLPSSSPRTPMTASISWSGLPRKPALPPIWLLKTRATC